MVSKINIILLGIIAEKPMNPYEMTKYIKALELRAWFAISDSSVYTAVKTMAQKDLISGETVKDSNMPEKTVYSITQHGKRHLEKALEATILDFQVDYVYMNLAILFLYRLGKAKATSLLEKRLLSLRSQRTKLENQKTRIDKKNLGLAAALSQERIMKLMDLEIDTTVDLLYYLSNVELSDKLMSQDLLSSYQSLFSDSEE